MAPSDFPVNLVSIAAARDRLAGQIIRTPVVDLCQPGLQEHLPPDSRAVMKLELFQKAGSFKARGAFLSVTTLTDAQRNRGLVAASGGNHGLAVSWAAKAAGVGATIAMPKATDPFRVEGCKTLGADVVLCDDIAHAFSTMKKIEARDNRAIIHPFEGVQMSLGAASCGAEFFEDTEDLQAVVLPVGGGGLISGMAAAFKLLNPNISIYGVEPFGADTMYRSFQSGSAQAIEKVDTIADSLGSPTALPFSFGLTRQYVDEIVRVSDDELRSAMSMTNRELKLMPEPACAASLAGAIGPLREELKGKRIGLLACGSNIGLKRYCQLIG